MELKLIKLDIPKDCQIILGQSHFIKTVEDLHEAMVNSVPGIKFGLAFCESSGPCLVRHSGTDEELEKIAAEQALKLGAGHCFLIIMRGAYPINVLNRIKEVPEVCTIYCATGNPIKVLIIEDEEKNRGIAGVIDGFRSKGIENEENVKERKEFLRKIGYKL
ncbi:MAG: adenosine-specific kinase [Nitrososphaerota archaeon]